MRMLADAPIGGTVNLWDCCATADRYQAKVPIVQTSGARTRRR